MKRNDVELGATYVAKVSGKQVHIRIEREGAQGGWDAVTVETGRKIDVKSAQRLRRAVASPRRDATEPTADSDVCATVGCDRPAALMYLGRARCQECYADEVADGDAELETSNDRETDMATKKSSKKAAKTTKAPKAAKQPKVAKAAKPAAEAKPKRVSALDAAAQVLQTAAKPMRANEMIVAMAEAGLWESPNGKTPHATLYAAILR